ncbi:MAG TPA: MerC domain-containing protein [Woeseiaceae bacterium]|nr:MerC domain-containing protein [Woeseiaceae bacterium]
MSPSSGTLDRAAVVLSGLCVLHCLALPVLVLGTPFVAALASSHWHAPMLLVVVPVSVFAILRGYRQHGNKPVPWFGALALALLIVGGTLAHNWYGAAADRTLTVAGSLLLAAVHWQNGRLARHLRRRESLALAES